MFEQIRANKIKSGLILGGMALLLVSVGYAAGEYLAPGGGVVGLIGAGVLWAVMAATSYFAGDRMLLGMSHARPITKTEDQRLLNVVEEMCIASGLPMPKVYVIDDSAPNAFATGRKPEKASIAVTSGLLSKLSRDELQGVVAHEMSHIKNRDVLFMMIAGIMLGVIVLICDFYIRRMFWFGTPRRRGRGRGGGQGVLMLVAILLAVVAPLIARLMYLAISRRREYLADASAAALTRYPEGLASALEKIANDQEVLEAANRATAPMYIVNPIKAWEKRARSLTSTHPPIHERIRILRSMGHSFALADYERAYCSTTGKKRLMSQTTLEGA